MNNLESTFFEPGAGEGAFIIEILKRKLDLVKKKYNESLIMYENYSLLALSTVYGVELLEDNHDTCLMLMYNVFETEYKKVCAEHSKKLNKNLLPKNDVKSSASLIIKKNIIQGDFLKEVNLSNNELVFSEWKPEYNKDKTKIKVTRTEYTLHEIRENKIKIPGEMAIPLEGDEIISTDANRLRGQTDLFTSNFEEKEEDKIGYRYTPCFITKVYLQDVEKIIYEEKQQK